MKIAQSNLRNIKIGKTYLLYAILFSLLMQFTLSSLAASICPPFLSFGETAVCQINAPGEEDTYSFTASAGDKVLVSMAVSSGYLDPQIRLIRPDGTEVCSAFNAVGGFAEIAACILPNTGTYTILVNDYGDTDTGNYGLYLQRLNQPGNTTLIDFGQVISASIDSAAEADNYSFTASAGDKVLVSMAVSSGYLDPQIRLIRPDGTEVCSAFNAVGGFAEIAACILPNTGTYTILVNDYGDTDTGNYGLYLQRLNQPGNVTPINFGQCINATIGSAAEMDTYTFTAPVTENVLISMAVSSGYLDPQIRLFGPDGAVACSAFSAFGGTAETSECPLQAGITYSILASDYGDTDTGGYNLCVGAFTRGTLSVTPTQDLASSGYQGGPFTPNNIPYVLRNTGDGPLSWATSNTQSWVSLSATSGTLAKGASTTVRTSINENANGLSPNIYNDTISFFNTVNTNETAVRNVILTVLQPETGTPLPIGQTERILLSAQPVLFEVSIPQGSENLFLLLQRQDYGIATLEVSKNGALLSRKSGFNDFAIQIPNPTPGNYIFKLSGSGPVVITALTSLRELQLGEWTTGTILRSWGSAWYQVTVPADQATLNVAVETLGLWSQMNVFYGILESNQRWSATGDRMNLQIPSPAAGRYYIQLSDSAWGFGPDERRDHMIKADVNPIEAPPAMEPTILSFSPTKGGNTGQVTVTIKGAGLDPTATVSLTRAGENTIVAQSVSGADNKKSLTATFDLTAVNPGEWVLSVKNPDGQTVTAPMPFTIESGGEAKLWVDIVGREIVRAGRETTYHLLIGNAGAVDIFFNLFTFEIFTKVPNVGQPPIFQGGGIINVVPPGKVETVPISVPGLPEKCYILVTSVGGESKPIDKLTCKELLAAIKDGWDWWINDGGKKEYDATKAEIIIKGCKCSGYDKHPDCRRLCARKTQYEASITAMCLACGKYREKYDKKECTQPLPPECLLFCNQKSGSNSGAMASTFDPAIAGQQELPLAAEASKKICAISSISPEDKYGPTGYDLEATLPDHFRRYIPGDRVLAYKVDFWNKETAPAPTQDVIITDQLDTNLDWSTFSFTEFGFLKWTVPLEGGQYFKVDVDLRPDMNLIVNVEGTFDPATGQIRWEFHSLDPVTREPPEDPMAGFLPPITDSGYEIGWVNFEVKPKTDLPTGTEIRNQAWVKFDVDVFKPAPPNPDSEIPGYGPYLNTIDSDKPASQVAPLPATQPSATFQVSWSGTDVGAGVKDYTLYVSEDGGPFTVWLADTPDASGMFTGQSGKSYAFYSVAQDQVGNVENIPSGPDVSTQVVMVLPGDLNGDGRIDCNDLRIVKAAFGKQSGQMGFDPRADVNSDNAVDVRDLAAVARTLPAGTRCP